ncbi:MAG: AAA family ATPase [Anaerolineae bacterium]|nr:AAA family ATPase [Anaerolineae bacterium]
MTGITVSGFKSLRDESRIEVRPLTILAGANSSGKSSIMQPLLLMKQTLEADYDPGVFLLDGSNVTFTTTNQFLFRTGLDIQIEELSIAVERYDDVLINRYEKKRKQQDIHITSTIYQNRDTGEKVEFQSNMSHKQILRQLPKNLDDLRSAIENFNPPQKVLWNIVRERCFLYMGMQFENGDPAMTGDIPSYRFFPLSEFIYSIREIIHVPGLRNKPERNYPFTPHVVGSYKGVFERYIASIVNHWYRIEDTKIINLAEYLGKLGLAGGIGSKRIDDTRVELLVGRTLLSKSADDTVSIADVGFGVSQVLPILVALLVAEPGQLVYIEQPELHLHPRAQVALAQVLADAANRGVKVVAETHSTLLIQGIQTLIAEQKLDHEDVIFHWFKRSEDGVTQITSQEPDELGAYGDWPEDFADVQFEADNTYLEAVEKRRAEELHDGQEPEMSGD